MDEARITPTRWYYILAGGVFVAGCVLFAGFLYASLRGMEAGLLQVIAPGETDLTLREPGTYTIFYEYQSVIGGKVYSTGRNLSGLECLLESKAKGASIAIVPDPVTTTYAFGERCGRSVYKFRINQPGVYKLSAGYSQDQRGPEIVLAVGKDFTAGLIATIFRSLALVFGSAVIALAIVVTTLVRRVRAKERIALGERPAAPAA